MKWKENWKVIDEKPIDGGQGAVLKVRNLKSDEVGALKIMHSSQIGSSKRRERFKKEADALSRLSNSTTPNLLEFNEGSESEEPYFISDWIEGTTLDSYTQNKPIQIEDAITLVRSLAKTLDEAHEVGIVHRDIKPSNIIVDRDHPTIIDFGLCYIENEEEKKKSKTPLGEELGNRFLRLPELTAGSEDKQEKISDVTFLVGILFYLCTGKPPRQLKDAENRKPHQRLSEEEIANLSKNPLWSKIQRIFNIGFEQSVNLRF